MIPCKKRDLLLIFSGIALGLIFGSWSTGHSKVNKNLEHGQDHSIARLAEAEDKSKGLAALTVSDFKGYRFHVTVVDVGFASFEMYVYEPKEDWLSSMAFRPSKESAEANAEKGSGTIELFESEVSRWISALLRELDLPCGATFFDVGANIGSITLPVAATPALAAKKAFRVISVEANPFTAMLLRHSMHANNFIHAQTINAAFVDSSQTATKSACMLTKIGANTNKGVIDVEYVQDCPEGYSSVPTTTTAQLLSKHQSLQRVVFAKLDCEGCEGNALSDEWLSSYPPCMMLMEVSPKLLNTHGTQWRTLLGRVQAHGYDAKLVNEWTLTEQTRVDSFSDVTDDMLEAQEKQLAGNPAAIVQWHWLFTKKDLEGCIKRVGEAACKSGA